MDDVGEVIAMLQSDEAGYLCEINEGLAQHLGGPWDAVAEYPWLNSRV